MIAEILCKLTKNQWGLYLKWVNFMICKLHFNKTVKKKKKSPQRKLQAKMASLWILPIIWERNTTNIIKILTKNRNLGNTSQIIFCKTEELLYQNQKGITRRKNYRPIFFLIMDTNVLNPKSANWLHNYVK